MSEDDSMVVWVGNLDDRVSEELIYELFLQAGPVEYVRQPKDKASGRKKNFAFVGYKHDCSVPYAISLMNSIKLFGRNIKVQNRYLQNLEAQGISIDPQGIHTLAHFDRKSSNEGPEMSQMKNSSSLMGQPPAVNFPANIPPHILALAQQQMSMLNTPGMVPLSQNPSLNARMRPRNDNYGSINYNYGQESRSGQHYDRYQNNRSRGSRSFDNKTMQSLKMNLDAATAQNSQMLAAVQEQHGHFDKNRLGHSHSNYNEDRYERDYDNRYDNRYQRNHESQHKSSRDYRQQPYDRHESHHSRHDRHGSSDSRRSYDEKGRGGDRNRSYSNDRYSRGGGYQPHYNSRR